MQVHHHHYPESVVESCEDQYVVEEDAEYMEDDYIGAGDYYEEDDYYEEHDYYEMHNYYEEDDYSNTKDSEYSGEDESDVAFSTSYGEDSECSSGYDDSSS